MTVANRSDSRLIRGMIAAPPCTARAPPSQKSFWASMTRSASVAAICMASGRRDLVDFVGRTEDDRHPLVQFGGGHVHDGLSAVRGGFAACLFDQEGHGVALIHKAK